MADDQTTPITAWCGVAPTGLLALETIGSTKECARWNTCNHAATEKREEDWTWPKGWRVVPVEVKERTA